MTAWPQLSAPVDPMDTLNIARAMSDKTRNGRVPTFTEAVQYAREAMADHPAADELRAAFQFKYGD